MKVLETKSKVIQALNGCRSKDVSIGFAPTMGALHEGHLSLIGRSATENDVTVASIFVNPTQFDDKNDFARYPRDLAKDLEMLDGAGCDIVFAPSVQEMYPKEEMRAFDFGLLDKVMEGAFRPGHFNGVAHIVSRLFDVVKPDKAYFGEKDFQQLAIIRRLVEIEGLDIEIIGCPIIREADGLAMSSRNTLLTPEQRKNAAIIYRTLLLSKEKAGIMPLQELKKWAIEQIDATPEMKTEYFEIVDKKTLEKATEYKENDLQSCVAVRVGNVRLIDNN